MFSLVILRYLGSRDAARNSTAEFSQPSFANRSIPGPVFIPNLTLARRAHRHHDLGAPRPGLARVRREVPRKVKVGQGRFRKMERALAGS
jgi:hypothetical protein